MTPLINTQIVKAALTLYLEYGGKQTDLDAFGLATQQIGTNSAYFPSKPFLLFMNYVVLRLTPKDVYHFLAKLVNKVSIPDTLEYLDPPPATVEEGINQMIAVSRKIMPHSSIRLEKGIGNASIKREKQIHNVKDETAAELYTLVFVLNLIGTLSGKKEFIPNSIGLISLSRLVWNKYLAVGRIAKSATNPALLLSAF